MVGSQNSKLGFVFVHSRGTLFQGNISKLSWTNSMSGIPLRESTISTKSVKSWIIDISSWLDVVVLQLLLWTAVTAAAQVEELLLLLIMRSLLFSNCLVLCSLLLLGVVAEKRGSGSLKTLPFCTPAAVVPFGDVQLVGVEPVNRKRNRKWWNEPF